MRVHVNGKDYEQRVNPASVRDDGESMYYGLSLFEINPNLLKDMEDAFSAENSVDIAGCTDEGIGVVVFSDGKTALEISACVTSDECLVCNMEASLTEEEKQTLDRLAAQEEKN